MDDIEKCPICQQYKNTLLQLTCGHDPCISCAAVSFSRQKKLKSSISNIYQCSLCKALTTLDRSTIEELEKTHSFQKSILDSSSLEGYSVGGSPRKTSPKKNVVKTLPKGFVEDNDTDASVDILQGLSRKRSKSPTISNRKGVTCKAHPQQGVSYFCMECLQNICAQCAINGYHRGHKAKPTKKAISQIRSEYEMMEEKSLKAQEIMKKQELSMMADIEDLEAETSKNKSQLTKQFDLLRRSIDTKEKELHAYLDDLFQRNQSLILTEAEIIRQRVELTKRFIADINNMLSRDDIAIMGEYGHFKYKFTEEILKPVTKRENVRTVGVRQPAVRQIGRFVEKVRQDLQVFKITLNDKHKSKSRGKITQPPNDSLRYSDNSFRN